MKAHLQYLWYVIRHKWFVLLAGLRLGVPIWQLLIHDWTKFRPSEWIAYTCYFYGDYPEHDPADPHKWLRRGYHGPESIDIKHDFDVAWNHHQHRNPHHWQYWLLINDQPGKDWVVTSPDGIRFAGLANYVRYPGRNLLIMDAVGDQANQDADELAAILNRAPVALQMPDRYVREMVADWVGAGRAITGKIDVTGWYAKTKNVIILHPATRARVEELIKQVQP